MDRVSLVSDSTQLPRDIVALIDGYARPLLANDERYSRFYPALSCSANATTGCTEMVETIYRAMLTAGTNHLLIAPPASGWPASVEHIELFRPSPAYEAASIQLTLGLEPTVGHYSLIPEAIERFLRAEGFHVDSYNHWHENWLRFDFYRLIPASVLASPDTARVYHEVFHRRKPTAAATGEPDAKRQKPDPDP